MIVSAHALQLEYRQRWRRQIGCRTRLALERGPRPHALLSYRVRDLPPCGLVPLRSMTFVVLFDEWLRDDHEQRRLATRLLGFGAMANTDGIRIGGAPLCRFEKDLRRPPALGRRGKCLDALDRELAEAALGWERHLERQARHPYCPRRTIPKLPAFWCAVEKPAGVFRRHGKHLLVPLEQAVSNRLPLTRVFVDLASLPKRQVVTIAEPHRSLSGRVGAIEFDFYHSRFSSAA